VRFQRYGGPQSAKKKVIISLPPTQKLLGLYAEFNESAA
jgi:hypothetical protein